MRAVFWSKLWELPKSRIALPPLYAGPVRSSYNSFVRQHVAWTSSTDGGSRPSSPAVRHLLPLTCPGCGGFTQSQNLGEPGHYSLNRSAIIGYLAAKKAQSLNQLGRSEEHSVSDHALHDVGTAQSGEDVASVARHQGVAKIAPPIAEDSQLRIDVPLCDRCHNLVHHQLGDPVVYPTVDSLQALLEDSEVAQNNVYHLIDALDFPLSLVSKLSSRLALKPPRSANRRARRRSSQHGNKLSFVITRSDLLASRKEQVDRLLPQLREILRGVLKIRGRAIRLGNVYCVSANRGWWTRELKNEIFQQGGANWLVGQVNVGKSSLFKAIFPKGNSDQFKATDATVPPLQVNAHTTRLLPPLPPEQPYPVMPTISSLAGTTAAPVRHAFGRGKGELIDLPGLQRATLGDYLMEPFRSLLPPRKRLNPKQLAVKPGQSLLIGNLVRITPDNASVIFQMCPFVPLPCEVLNAETAWKVLTEQEFKKSLNVSNPGLGSSMACAGAFDLAWDVTAQRTGNLTAALSMRGKSPELPFKVLSCDILLAGLGWIEVAAQVRTRAGSSTSTGKLSVKVDSPSALHVGHRESLNCWAHLK